MEDTKLFLGSAVALNTERPKPEIRRAAPPLASVRAQMTEPLFLRTMHFLCRVAAQDTRFRTEGNALAKEYEAIMEANGVHFCGCSCGCNGNV